MIHERSHTFEFIKRIGRKRDKIRDFTEHFLNKLTKLNNIENSQFSKSAFYKNVFVLSQLSN